MSTLEAIVLGIVQGLGEFLPISSSGHLELTRWLFGWEDLSTELETSFDVAVHLGTLAAVIVYFWKDMVRYATAGLGALSPNQRPLSTDATVAWMLVVSMVPAAISGVLLEEFLAVDRIWLIAVALILGGLVLLAADRLGGTRKVEGFRLRDALLMGMGQALALQPGVSRSGATITVGRFIGFDRDAAARIAFLMSIPVIAGAGVYKGLDLSLPGEFIGPFIWGMVAAALTGYAAIWGTMTLIRTRTFTPFVVYRVIAGAAVLILLATGVR
ncbi:MAG: undecaprenyl-diphosphate phosphatase [Acidimicrobiales bacterium]|nr:undecaprenyl-diphosphate phosphatase [Acidimicrobiales bacterium]